MPDRRQRLVMRQLRRWLGGSAELPDQQLLERFVLGQDEEAFAELVNRHGPMVLGVCRRVLGNAMDADDAFQATFMTLARKAGTIRRRGSAGPWLHGVARRISLRARARATRRAVVEQEAARQATLPEPADPSWREVCDVLDAEVHRLPERLRAPLVLCYLEGNTRDEAAASLGWSLGTLKRRLEQ